MQTQPQMNTTTSLRRSRPAKPVRTVPVEKTKTASCAEALSLLNEFVKDARKEIRKRDTLQLKGRLNETDCDSISFLGDTFTLTIDFKEGFKV